MPDSTDFWLSVQGQPRAVFPGCVETGDGYYTRVLALPVKRLKSGSDRGTFLSPLVT